MSLSRRRVTVVSLYLGYLALGVTWCRLGGRPTGPAWGVLAVAALVFLGGLIGVWQVAHGLILAPAQLLDERQRSVRDRAFRVSYILVSLAFLAAAAGYSWLVTRALQEPGASISVLVPLGFSAFLLVVSLPLAVVAWTEPDPPEDSGTFTKTAK